MTPVADKVALLSFLLAHPGITLAKAVTSATGAKVASHVAGPPDRKISPGSASANGFNAAS